MQSDDLISLLLCLNSEESAGLQYKVESHHIIISDLADADAVTRNENLGLSVSQAASQCTLHHDTLHCWFQGLGTIPVPSITSQVESEYFNAAPEVGSFKLIQFRLGSMNN